MTGAMKETALQRLLVFTEKAVNNEKLKFFGFLALSLLGAVVLYRFRPGGSILYPPCPFHALTGLYCPGCGTLRGLHALLHGRLLVALDYNPLMVLSLPFLGYAFLSHTLFVFRGKRLPRIINHPRWIWLILVIIIIYWIARNVPVYPLTILAP
jgi:hypothetical protein